MYGTWVCARSLTTQLNCTHPDLTASLLELWRMRVMVEWGKTQKQSGKTNINKTDGWDGTLHMKNMLGTFSEKLTWNLQMWNPPTHQSWAGLLGRRNQSPKWGLYLEENNYGKHEKCLHHVKMFKKFDLTQKQGDHQCQSEQLGLSAVLQEAAWRLQPLLLVEVGADPHPSAAVWNHLHPSSWCSVVHRIMTVSKCSYHHFLV